MNLQDALMDKTKERFALSLPVPRPRRHHRRPRRVPVEIVLKTRHTKTATERKSSELPAVRKDGSRWVHV